jgi:hypothetical protein
MPSPGQLQQDNQAVGQKVEEDPGTAYIADRRVGVTAQAVCALASGQEESVRVGS